MAEALLRDQPAPEPIRFPQEEQRWVPASQALLEQLQQRWEELKARLESSAAATQRSLATELREDTEYVKVRARYYHERQPLQTVGMAAAGAFLLGMMLGFWRR